MFPIVEMLRITGQEAGLNCVCVCVCDVMHSFVQRGRFTYKRGTEFVMIVSKHFRGIQQHAAAVPQVLEIKTVWISKSAIQNNNVSNQKWRTWLFCSGTKLQHLHMVIPHKISYTRSSYGSNFTTEPALALAWYPPLAWAALPCHHMAFAWLCIGSAPPQVQHLRALLPLPVEVSWGHGCALSTQTGGQSLVSVDRHQ